MNKSIFCCSCGVEFSIPEELDMELRKKHRTFYCPNGHGQCYAKETEAEKWKKLFEEESMKNKPVQEQKEEINRLKAQLNAYKGVVTRLKRKKGTKVVIKKAKDKAAEKRKEAKQE